MLFKHAVLTIDDAPSKDMAQKLDFLESKGITAIWFCSGIHLEEWPAFAINAIKRGNVIANHAYDHPYFSKISLDECFNQIRRTDTIIADLYTRSGCAQNKKHFRFPYGDKGGLRIDSFGPYTPEGVARKKLIQDFLANNGYSQPRFGNITYLYFDSLGLRSDADCSWTYDCVEWSTFVDEHVDGIDTVEKVIQRMDRDEPEKGFGLNSHSSDEIILTHDHPETTAYFPRIIEALQAKGLKFIMPQER